MDPIERRRGAAAYSPRVLARLLLLGAVIAAVFALHVLTAESDHSVTAGGPAAASAHYPGEGLPVAVPVSGIEQATVAGAGMFSLTAPLVGHPDDTGSGEGLLAGCIMFLVVVGPAALLALLVRWRLGTESARPGPGIWGASARRGPPSPALMPRLALCVIRI